MRFFSVGAAGAALLAACACAPAEETGPARLSGGAVAVEVDRSTGHITIERDGVVVIGGAVADVLVAGEGRPRSLAGPLEEVEPGRFVGRARDLELSLAVSMAGEAATFTLVATSRAAEPITVLSLAPLVADARLGAELDVDPRARVLENGRAIFFDQTAQISTVDGERFALADALPIPIPLRGRSISNWSHAIEGALVAGFLSAERAVPTLGVGPGIYAAECAMVYHGKTLAPGESVASETLWIEPRPADPLGALERYAEALAAHAGTTVWTRRDGGRPVPNGWNSWSGGGGSGGHGQAIDQAIVSDAGTRLAGALGEFGLEYLQIDDGWQTATGDWQWDARRFPAGMEAARGVAEAHGLQPGLWIAPFLATRGSTLARQHPGWLMARAEGLPGAAAKDGEALDPSNAGVRAHLRALGARLRSEGWRWIKLDFAYFSLLGKMTADPTLTQVEAWRAAWRAFRDGLGPEAFLLGVGVVGGQIGVADGMRLTLDDGPRWDEDDPDGLASGGALKSSVRTGARRWFYGNRALVPHPDLIFFRSFPGGAHPALSFEEARTFATWVGLTGGIVKIGDRMDDLFADPRNVDVIRRLLPAWPEPARPLDVMDRDYPERFELALPTHRVLGLFHWGKNRDLATGARLDPERPRAHAVRCDVPCHVYSFWDERYLGVRTGAFEIEVAPRSVALLSLVPVRAGEPQLVGTRRHVSMGAMDVVSAEWRDPLYAIELRGAPRGTAQHPWEDLLVVALPPGRRVTDADGATVEHAGGVARIRFTGGSVRRTIRLE